MIHCDWKVSSKGVMEKKKNLFYKQFYRVGGFLSDCEPDVTGAAEAMKARRDTQTGN